MNTFTIRNFLCVRRLHALDDHVGEVHATLISETDRLALIPVYLACDWVAIPSFYDGMPNVLLAALALGVPVLAADAGGMPELVRDGENGLLFAAGDLEACRSAIEHAARRPAAGRRDRAARSGRGGGGLPRAAHADGRPGTDTPDSYASTTACTRSRSPSFMSDAGDVRLDRRLADDQLGRDLGVREAARDEPETSSSRAVSSSRPFGGFVLAGAVAANCSISRLVTDGASSDSPCATTRMAAASCSRRRVLEQEAAGPGAQRVVDVLVEVERREHQHPHGRVGPCAASCRVASMPSSWGMRMSISTTSGSSRPPARRPRRRRTPRRPPRVVLGVEDHREAGADERLVVRDQDADDAHARAARWATSSPRGRRTWTSKPPPCRRPAPELAAVHPHALAHADEAVAAAGSRDVAGAGCPVCDVDLQRRHGSARAPRGGPAPCLTTFVSASWTTR